MLALLAAIAIAFLECRTPHSAYNGYGAITGALRKDGAAPMRYRVLVPWLIKAWYKLTRIEVRVWHYRILKGLLAWAAFSMTDMVFGPVVMLVMAVLVASTVEFDYWDLYAELLGITAVLSGDPALTAIGSLVWGLSRETAGLAPFISLSFGGPWPWALAAPLALVLVRVVQGRARLYCERWTFLTYNLYLDPGLFYSVLVSAGIVWGALSFRRLPHAMAMTAWAPIVLVGAGWLMARARETRIFLPACLWLAVLIGGYV